MTETITTERVFELIETYGAEAGAWPDDERDAALARLAADPDLFATAMSEARALDALLDAAPLPEPSADLSEQIIAQAPRATAPSNLFDRARTLLFPQGARWPAGAALASLLMGIFGGYAYASTGIGYDTADAAYYAAFGLEETADWLEAE